MRQKCLQAFFFAHFEQRIIHWAVVAQIDEMSSTIFASRTDICMLKQPRERVAGITDINPVAIGQLAIESENETLRPIGLPPLVLVAVVLRQGGYKPTS